MKQALKRLLSGFLMGIGTAIPGVSGGTIAVIVGIYENILKAVSAFFSNFKQSALYLLPIAIGLVCGFIPCVILFDKLFAYMLFAILCLFAGLMIGSLPKICKSVKNEKPTKCGVICLLLCGLIAIAIGICSVYLNGKINIESYITIHTPVWFYFIMIPVGILASTALVIPGISGSMLLLILGFYKPLISAISALFRGQGSNIGPLIGLLFCMALGILIGFYFISKAMHHLFNKYYQITMYGIIGFVIGSIIVLFFNNTIYDYYLQMASNSSTLWMRWYMEVPLGIILLILGAISSYMILKYAKQIELKGERGHELGD